MDVGGRECVLLRAQPKLALPRGGPPQRTSRLFIARIPPSVTEEQFRQYFESFGCVQVAALADALRVFVEDPCKPLPSATEKHLRQCV